MDNMTIFFAGAFAGAGCTFLAMFLALALKSSGTEDDDDG